jgi:hypothetical protein
MVKVPDLEAVIPGFWISFFDIETEEFIYPQNVKR